MNPSAGCRLKVLSEPEGTDSVNRGARRHERHNDYTKLVPSGGWSVMSKVGVLVGTRKGAFVISGNKSRRSWEVSEPQFLGHIVHHMVQDPRDPLRLLVAARTGHLGPTVFRSTNLGKSWKE